MSGLRVFLFSVTVNWLTARKLLLAGLSKSMMRTLRPANGAVVRLVLHSHAIDQHAVEGAVAGLHSRTLRVGKSAQGVIKRL